MSTPMITAAVRGNAEMILVLHELGAEVDQEAMGLTPLVSAIQMNNPEAVMILCKLGADVNKKPSSSGPPILEAVLRGYVDIIKILHSSGASIKSISLPDDQFIPNQLATVSLLSKLGISVRVPMHSYNVVRWPQKQGL